LSRPANVARGSL